MSVEPEPPCHDPLRRHLSGKRRWHRVDRPSLVELRGPRAAFMGQVLDLSRGGLRFAIVDPSFYAAGGSEDTFALVTQHFPSGVTVRFVEEGVSHPVEVVRITPHEDRWLALGCRFETPLANGDAARLGIADDAADGDDAAHVLESTRDV